MPNTDSAIYVVFFTLQACSYNFFTLDRVKIFYYRAALHAVLSIAKPSVRPSVTRVNCDKTNESSADILIPYERTIHLGFRHEEWLVGDVPFYLKFWAKLTSPRLKTAISNRYSLVCCL